MTPRGALDLAVAVACAFACAVPLLACGKRAPGGPAAHAALGGDVAARVGDVDISAADVASVAAARSDTPVDALARLVDDAVAARAAHERGLDRTPDVRFGVITAKARATVTHLRADAHATLPTDDEVRALSASHWVEVDRPESFVVIHAVVVRPKKPDPAAEAVAKAVAARIEAAEAGAVDAADFEARAKAVPADGAEVKVERLDPFIADGRVAMPGPPSAYDERFAAGAATLSAPGATSHVVESPFGWHVIRLLERRPPLVVPFDQRRTLFSEEVYATRANEALQKVEAARRTLAPVSYVNGLDELLAEALPAVQTHAAAGSQPGP